MHEYEKRMTDAYGDRFDVKAEYGLVHVTGYEDGDTVADLAFNPEGALKTARHLIKAAAVAYEQEGRAASR